MAKLSWKYKYRMINGKRRYVKVAKRKDGTEIVRIANHKNYSDKARIGKK